MHFESKKEKIFFSFFLIHMNNSSWPNQKEINQSFHDLSSFKGAHILKLFPENHCVVAQL